MDRNLEETLVKDVSTNIDINMLKFRKTIYNFKKCKFSNIKTKYVKRMVLDLHKSQTKFDKSIRIPKTINFNGIFSSYDNRELWTISSNKNLKGLICFFEEYDSLYVCWLYVDKKYRRQSIATELLKLAEKRAEDLNKKYIKLDVYKTNYKARKLYKKYGFRKEENYE